MFFFCPGRTTCETGLLGALAGSSSETLVVMTLRGDARSQSRGVEGLSGCSGEGLHPCDTKMSASSTPWCANTMCVLSEFRKAEFQASASKMQSMFL